MSGRGRTRDGEKPSTTRLISRVDEGRIFLAFASAEAEETVKLDVLVSVAPVLVCLRHSCVTR